MWWTLLTDYCLIYNQAITAILGKQTNQIAACNIVLPRDSHLQVSKKEQSAGVVTQPRQYQALLQQANVVLLAQEIRTRSVVDRGE